ncbi:aldose 1-epimerase [Granulicella sp. L60]|jgi:aldose 1-epimerase|uniref:aldose 1-epimerase n=1 Tax=Granulicella sp. L60 TaxID=1641866 RepID=UPI0020B17397|nr:aldose 1-epimerase [Granulicella sp. L60]
MYWALLKQGFAARRRKLWHAALMRSGLLTIVFLMVVVSVLAVGWHEHILGHFAELKHELNKRPEPEAVAVRPGGQDVVRLERSAIAGDPNPEFLSATLLPGRGMNVFQITATLPLRGEVNLLDSPSLEDAGRLLTGTGADSTGSRSLNMGGAIEVPWAGRVSGSPAAEGQNLSVMWHGTRLMLPADTKDSYDGGGTMAAGGLLLKMPSDTVTSNVMPDGGQAQAVFHAGNFDGHWPSHTEITTTVELSGRAIEMRVMARNTGTTAEPMGIGWHPRFAILNGHRGQMMLRLPSAMRVDVKDRRNGDLSGRLVPVEGTEYDFTQPKGAKLGALNLDDSFVRLKRGMMDNGPMVELRDPENDYGLRITAVTPTIKAIRVYAPLDGSYISIEPQFNYDDPFGRQWAKGEDTGMVVLQPGESTQWKIRLEIFSLSSNQTEHL